MFWRKIRDTKDDLLTVRELDTWKERVRVLEDQIAELMQPVLQAAIDEYKKLGGYQDFEVSWRHITVRTGFSFHTTPTLYTEQAFREKFILPLKAAKYEECKAMGKCEEPGAGQVIYSNDVSDGASFPSVYTWTTTGNQSGKTNRKNKKGKSKYRV